MNAWERTIQRPWLRTETWGHTAGGKRDMMDHDRNNQGRPPQVLKPSSTDVPRGHSQAPTLHYGLCGPACLASHHCSGGMRRLKFSEVYHSVLTTLALPLPWRFGVGFPPSLETCKGTPARSLISSSATVPMLLV